MSNLDIVGCLEPPLSKASPPHASGGVIEGDRSDLEDIPGEVTTTGDPNDDLPCKSSCHSVTKLIYQKGTHLHKIEN